jgi:4-hydroxy-2-oxoheptanedioate aldolase
METILQQFKEKIQRGFPVFGPFMKTGDAAFVEAAGYGGFDFVILDMEHGPNSLETMQNLVRAALIAGVVPIIRTRDRQPESISQALDIGALGVQVPQITNANDVQQVLRAARFLPAGERGVCRFVRAARYSSIPATDYFRAANEALVIVQLEGNEAIKNMDEIFSEQEVDIFFIGPYDLSQSLGVPGQVDHPIVLDAVQNMIDKARKNSCAVGLFTDTLGAALKWKDLGVNYVSFSVDVGIFYEACRSIIKELKAK